jgi:hypothetical protein
MVPRAHPPSRLCQSWGQTGKPKIWWLASSRSKPSDLDACPALSSLRRFCGATDKLRHAWFWGSNQETITVILRPKSPNRSCRFWGPNQKTRATGFEVKPEKTVRVVLRSNHSQTIDLVFEAQSRNTYSSSPRARCRPHIASPDLPIIQSPSIRPMRPCPVLCTRSSTPATILGAVCHVTPATCTPRDKQTRFSKWNRDKGKTSKISWIRIQTSTS